MIPINNNNNARLKGLHRNIIRSTIYDNFVLCCVIANRSIMIRFQLRWSEWIFRVSNENASNSPRLVLTWLARKRIYAEDNCFWRYDWNGPSNESDKQITNLNVKRLVVDCLSIFFFSSLLVCQSDACRSNAGSDSTKKFHSTPNKCKFKCVIM